MRKAMLIDTTRCIGCRGCQVACKSWNDLRAQRTGFSETGTNPTRLDATTFTRVLFSEVAAGDGLRWAFVKRQCMHCEEPACAAACPVGALLKLESGPVVYRDDRCIGCRYCMLACPFQVPKFEWAARVPYIRKCTFCADRQALGKPPACAATCPTGALLFGDRAALVAEGHRRIQTRPGRYHPELYGERTGGGTSMLYLTAFSLEQLGVVAAGFRTDLGDVPGGRRGEAWMSGVPWVAATVASLSLGLYRLNRRRAEVEEREGRGAKEIEP